MTREILYALLVQELNILQLILASFALDSIYAFVLKRLKYTTGTKYL